MNSSTNGRYLPLVEDDSPENKYINYSIKYIHHL